MSPITRLALAVAGLVAAAIATAEEPPFLQWNIQMRTPMLQGNSPVLLKNLWKPGKYMGSSQRDAFATGTVVAGINLHWWAGVAGKNGEYTDCRFELAPPPGTMSDPSQNRAFRCGTTVALRVGHRGYLKYAKTSVGINMEFSSRPAYEWCVLNLAPVADGITSNQKVALLNITNRSFLVYESRRIGFEVGWYAYSGTKPPTGGDAVSRNRALAWKSNVAVFQDYIEQLQKVNGSQARFVRSFFGIPRTDSNLASLLLSAPGEAIR